MLSLRQGRWIGLLLLWSCSKDGGPGPAGSGDAPTVGFVYSIGHPVAPVRVTFTNQSSGATDYQWDFGDGTTSADTDPVHVYAAGGSYHVKLIAVNGAGSNTTGTTLVIQPPWSACRVQRVILDEAPFTGPGGQPLDSASGPDFKVKIFYRNTTQELAVTNTVNDVTAAQLPLALDFSPPFPFPAFQQEYDVLLYDEDLPGNDELVDGYYFRLSDATTADYHYPDTMLLYQAGSSLKMNLVLDWSY